ncbi:MAG: hypothetical protein ACRDCJ_01865 [Metamycoplasmataceae bacterium]
MMKKENLINKEYFSKIVNCGFYISLLNFALFSLLVFMLSKIFLDPLNNILWISLAGTTFGFWLILLITTLVILMKIIVNNEWFFQWVMKEKKKYFILAIIMFIFNSAISFSMFKKCLKN